MNRVWLDGVRTSRTARVGQLTTSVVLLLVLVTTGVFTATAQVLPLAVRINTVRNADELKEFVKQTTDWLGSRLRLQTHYLAEACELNGEERRLLREAGEKALAETSKRLDDAVRNLRGVAPGGVIYIGHNVASRADLDRDVTAVDEGIRKELRKILSDALPDACKLSDSQREKLSLAGRLDINKWSGGKAVTPEQPPAGQEFVVQKVHVARGNSPLPVEIFRDPSSYFQRTFQGRVRDSQKRQLEAVERERRDFERRVLIEAAVVGFERTASLTSQQCEQLSAALSGALASNDPAGGDWRVACLLQIAELPVNELAVVLCDIQRPEVKRHQDEVAAAARQFEAHVANGAAPPPLMRPNLLLAD